MGFLDTAGRWLTGRDATGVVAMLDESATRGILTPFAEQSALAPVVWGELFPTFEQPIDRARAMSVPAVARIRHLATSVVGSLALVAVTSSGEAPARDTGIVAQPEPDRARALTWGWTVDALMFYGRAWHVVTDRYATGRPRSVRFVPEWAATVDERGRLTHAHDVPVDPADVIRIDGPHEGVLSFGRRAIRHAIEIEDAAAKVARNPVPATELHQTEGTPLGADDRKKLIDGWAKARAGENGGVAYTSPTVEARVHGTPAEALLVQGRNLAALDIARILGFPAWAVDATVGGSSLTYSNVPARWRELLDGPLRGYLDAIAQRYSLDDILPAGTWATWDTSTLLAGTFTERMAGYKAAIDAGIYTADQCRDLERGRPLERP